MKHEIIVLKLLERFNAFLPLQTVCLIESKVDKDEYGKNKEATVSLIPITGKFPEKFTLIMNKLGITVFEKINLIKNSLLSSCAIEKVYSEQSFNIWLYVSANDKTALLENPYFELFFKIAKDYFSINQEHELFINEISGLMSSLTHDIKSPVSAMTGFTQILFDDFHEIFSKDAANILEHILASSNRLNEIIEGIYTVRKALFSKIQLTMLDLKEVFLVAYSKIKNKYPSTSCDLSIEGVDTKIISDYMLLLHIFKNLIDNSFKFKRNDEKLTISIRFIKCFKGWFLVSYIDNTIGFDAIYSETVFKPFTKIHPVSDYKGAGSGLYAIKKSLERLGGKYEISPSLEKGVSFTLKFPCQNNG